MALEDKLLKHYPKLNKKTVKIVSRKMKKDKISGKGAIDKVVNAIVTKYNKLRGKKQDKADHVLKDGEKHVIFKNKDGALVRGQFAGPGTDLVGNLRKLLKDAGGDISVALQKDNFVSDVDRIALLHDSRYALEGADPDRVRRADEKMVEKIKDAEKAGESRFNTLPSKLGIQAKIKLSDLGLMDKGAFALGGSLEDMTDEEIAMVQSAVDHLEMMGYGRSRPIRGGGQGGGSIGDDTSNQWRDIEKMLASLKTQGGTGLSSNKLKKTKKADLVKMLKSIDLMFGTGAETSKLKPPFCRIGSKLSMVDDILSNFPQSYDTYIEPFVGGGAVFWSKKKETNEVINDLDERLYKNYKLIREVDGNKLDRLDTNDLTKLQAYVNKPANTKEKQYIDEILYSCNGFSSKPVNRNSKKLYHSSNPIKKIDNIFKYKDRLKGVKIHNKDYMDLMKEYDGSNSFFYLDPPYENSESVYVHSKMDYDKMASFLKSIKGKFLMSLNDSPNIRKIFNDFKIKKIKVISKAHYSVGGSDRPEIVISNY